MKHPLLILTISFCGGIIFAAYFKPAWPVIYLLAALFLAAGFFFLRSAGAFGIILLSLAFLCGTLILRSNSILPGCHIAKIIRYQSQEPCIIKGFIASEPQTRGKKAVLVLRAEEIQSDNFNRSTCGNILVYLRDKKSWHYGERLILRAKLYQPRGWGRGGSRYRDYLRRQDIWFLAQIKDYASFVRLDQPRCSFYRGLAIKAKNRLEGIIFQYLKGVPAGILDAMILGERSHIPDLVNNLMVKTGTVHILVVSGFNVGIVVFIIVLILRLLRLPYYWRYFASLPLIAIYCLVTGASNPVVRATVMAIIFILAVLIRRDPDISNAISLAVLFILAVNPYQLFDLGFQLSFASVAAIVFIYPKLREFFRLRDLKAGPLKFILEGCLVSLAAWIGTSGLIAYYFRIFSPVTVLANMLVVPLASLITLAGFSLIFAGLFFPWLAPLFARANEALIWGMVLVNNLMLAIPGASLRLPS